MKILTEKDIELLTFPDSPVIEFSLDLGRKVFSLKCSEAFLDLPDEGEDLSHLVVRIDAFQEVQVKEFKDEEYSGIEDYSEEVSLTDVCELEVDGERVAIKGFTKEEGQWVEFVFSGGTLTVVCD